MKSFFEPIADFIWIMVCLDVLLVEALFVVWIMSSVHKILKNM
jgi:hypothetical protein